MRRRYFNIKNRMPYNHIKYSSSKYTIINFQSDFTNVPILSNNYSRAKNEGILICDGYINSLSNSTWEKSNLLYILLPDSITSIESGTFNACSSLKEFKGKFASEDGRCLIIDGALNAFAPAELTEYTIPDSVTSIGDSAFTGCGSLASITIPNGVTIIGNYAFEYCTSLTSITLPEGLQTIGYYAFRNCYNLTSITLPEGLQTIGDNAFMYCTSLTSITLPEGLQTIGSAAFTGCTSLTTITIPEGLQTIGYRAFEYCRSLTSVYCKATIPPTLGVIDVFDYNGSGRKIYVPYQSLDAYKTAPNWSEYADDIVGYDFENDTIV